MKFSLLHYKPVSIERGAPVPLGVVLQTPDKIMFRFDTTTLRFESVKKLNPNADKETFSKLADTFKQNYIEGGGVIPTSDGNGRPTNILVTEDRFLDYLHNTFQNDYQYSTAREIQAPTPELALSHLFKTYIEESFAG